MQMVGRPLREREVVGSNPGRAIPKAFKMVPVATLLGAQHYKASTGSPLTHHLHYYHCKKLTKKHTKTNPSTWFYGTRLMSPLGIKTYRNIDSTFVAVTVSGQGNRNQPFQHEK